MKFKRLLIVLVVFLLSGCAVKQYGSAFTRLTLIYNHIVQVSSDGWGTAILKVNVPPHLKNRQLKIEVEGQPTQVFLLKDTAQRVWVLTYALPKGVYKVRIELWTTGGLEYDWNSLIWVQEKLTNQGEQP